MLFPPIRCFLATAAAGLAAAAPASALPRSTTDRPDAVSGKQIHVFYVLPSDRRDRQLDTNGTLANTVAAFRGWLAQKAGGRTLRLDTYQGEPDVTFRRMTRTDADMRSEGAFVSQAIEADLANGGVNTPNK